MVYFAGGFWWFWWFILLGVWYVVGCGFVVGLAGLGGFGVLVFGCFAAIFVGCRQCAFLGCVRFGGCRSFLAVLVGFGGFLDGLVICV